MLIVGGTLVPDRDHTIAERTKNYRNDCKAREDPGAKAAVGNTVTTCDGGYPGARLVVPPDRQRGQTELPDWKEEHNKSHK